MFDVSDPHRFRKTVAGACMILAPVLFLLSSVIVPGFDTDEAALLALATESPDAWLIAGLLAMAGWGLFFCAVLGFMHMLRERGVAEGHVGGALALLGTLFAVANTALLLVVWQMAAGDAAPMTALLERITGTTGTFVPLFILPLGVTVGVVVLAWGLYRHHFVPTWAAAALGLAGVLYAVASLAGEQWLFIAASAALLIGSGAIGRMVLQESVEDWDHTPELRGAAA